MKRMRERDSDGYMCICICISSISYISIYKSIDIEIKGEILKERVERMCYSEKADTVK